MKHISAITAIMIWVAAFGQATAQTDIQAIARALAAQVPELNDEYGETSSGDTEEDGGWGGDEKHYLRYCTHKTDGNERKPVKELQMYWYERPAAAGDLVLVAYNDYSELGFHPWLKCFVLDRKTGKPTAVDLPFDIPAPADFDREMKSYWRTEYAIFSSGNILISASPSMNASNIAFVRWDKNTGFTVHKRGVKLSYPSEDDAPANRSETEKYIQAVVRPNFQRINAIRDWQWIEEKEVYDLSLEGATLRYCYSEKGLEKITASLFGETYQETVEYYLFNHYLSFIYSRVKRYTKSPYNDEDNFDPEKDFTLEERRWYIRNDNCVRGIGNNGKELSPAEIKEEFLDGGELRGYYQILEH